MNLLHTSLLSFASTAIKMLAGLTISKTLAVVGGPAGLALFGQFQNFAQIALTAAKGALDTGVTKYTAEYGDDDARRFRLFSTAARICAGSCAVVVLILIVGAEALSIQFLHSPEYAYLMRLFGLTVALFVINGILLAIVNGLQEVRTYILVNIVQSILTMCLTLGLIAWLGMDGALVALVTNQSLVLVVLLWVLRGHMVIRVANFRRSFDRVEAARLCKFSLMTAVSALASPMSAIAVRNHITVSLGIDQAGYWQAMWYVSSVYLTLVTTSLSTYYLPKLSATTDPRALRTEVVNGYRIVLPIVTAAALIIYALREWVVRILFTDAFAPMVELFCWMLIGDVIKLAAWLVSYLMLAKAMTRAFIVTEVLFSANFVVLSMFLTQQYGIEGVTYAHVANYSLYLIVVAVITRRFWQK